MYENNTVEEFNEINIRYTYTCTYQISRLLDWEHIVGIAKFKINLLFHVPLLRGHNVNLSNIK